MAIEKPGIPTDRIYAFTKELLQAGCVYICTWGADCERWHDLMDEAVVGENPPASVREGVMTTSHENESMTDAVFYSFTCTIPDDQFSNCDTALILSPSLATQVRATAQQWLNPNG